MQEHDGHRARLKERFDKTRLLGFADHEVLELILFHSIPRRDTNPIAHALIREFGRDADDYCGISVGFCYTKTNEALFYYGDEWYYTASVFKLPLMMMLANDVLNGEKPKYDGQREE